MLANLLAMPVVSAWVMPMGILGVLAIPFGFDAEFWRQMGYGIEWMDAVALWVASLPGAFGRVTAFGTGPLLLATAGLLLIGLLKTPLRWSGAVFVVLAIICWRRARRMPDILVAGDGRTFAVRGADGRLAFHHTGGDTFAIHEWLAADADGRDVRDPGLATASPAIRPAASASSPTAGWFPTRWRRTHSRRIAGAPRRRGDARGAAGLCRDRDRAQPLARARRAALRRDGAGFVDRVGAAGEFRPALGTASAHGTCAPIRRMHRGARSQRAPIRDAAPPAADAVSSRRARVIRGSRQILASRNDSR